METVLEGAEIIQIEIGLFLESTQISVLFSFYCNQERAQMQWKRTGQGCEDHAADPASAVFNSLHK